MTDDAAAPVGGVNYDPWGRPRDRNDWTDYLDDSSTEDDITGFTGHQAELEAGLINMRGRMYDPRAARFASVDPVVAAPASSQGWSPHSYVLNRPLTFTDPTGHYPAGAEPPVEGSWGGPGSRRGAGISWRRWGGGGGGVFFVGGGGYHQSVTAYTQLRNMVRAISAGFNALGSGGGGVGPGMDANAASAAVASGNAVAPVASDSVSDADGRFEDLDALLAAHLLQPDELHGEGEGAALTADLAQALAGGFDWFIDSGVETTMRMIIWPYNLVAPEEGLGAWVRGQVGIGPTGGVTYDSTRNALTAAEIIAPAGGGLAKVGGRLAKAGGAFGSSARSASRMARRCFAPGTLVETQSGLIPIEEIDVGDRVWARDDETGEEAWRPVTDVFEASEREVLELTFVGASGTVEVLRVTPEHPLWSLDDSEWDEAGELEPGEQVDALFGPMRLVSTVASPVTATVFNLEVADSHTYFVGEAGIWAHNKCSIRSLLRRAGLPGGHQKTGAFRYRAPKGHQAGDPLPTIRNRSGKPSYVDRFGNIWTKGPNHGGGSAAFEWDVVLSESGRRVWGRALRPGKTHINVTVDGFLSH